MAKKTSMRKECIRIKLTKQSDKMNQKFDFKDDVMHIKNDK